MDSDCVVGLYDDPRALLQQLAGGEDEHQIIKNSKELAQMGICKVKLNQFPPGLELSELLVPRVDGFFDKSCKVTS